MNTMGWKTVISLIQNQADSLELIEEDENSTRYHRMLWSRDDVPRIF